MAQSTTNTVNLTGLTASTQYQVYVRARDGAGNLSNPSATTTFTTLAGTGGTCSASFRIVGSPWPTGFQGEVTIRNTGTTTINGWTITWSFPNGQIISNLWNGTYTQSGAVVTVRDLGWNATIAPNGTVVIGFNASRGATNNPPTGYTLNGANCTIV